MRYLISLATFAALLGGSSAATAVETLSVSGTIQQDPTAAAPTTIDTYGLFGTPGADLGGKPVTVLTQYLPAYLRTAAFCGNTCLFYGSRQGPHAPGSILIFVTINGVERSFVPGSAGEVDFGSFYTSGSVRFVFQPKVQDSQGNAAGVIFGFKAPVVYGQPLPASSIVTTGVAQRFHFTPGATSPVENLSFQAISASN